MEKESNINNFSKEEWAILGFLKKQKAPIRTRKISEEIFKKEINNHHIDEDECLFNTINFLYKLKSFGYVQTYNQKWSLAEKGRELASKIL